MIRPSRTTRLAIVAASAALVLASCAQDDSSDDNADDAPSSSPESSSDSAAAPTGDGTLTLGTLLPQTGDLGYLGPPEFAGVDLAVQEINDAGGVLGKPITQAKADSGDGTPDIAGQSVDKLLDADSDVIVGAASSSVSLSVIDKIIGAGVVQFSPANTAAVLDTYDDKGLYFRTSPSDALQGEVLGNMAVEDGFSNVAVMARQDSYGEGLAQKVVDTLEEKGATVSAHVLYSADAQNYTAEINEVAASKPDAIVLVAFEETVKIIPGLIAKNVGPQDVQMYFVDGNTADYSKDLPAGTLEGVKATFPTSAEEPTEFYKRMDEIDPKLDDYTYGPQSYDAVMLSALAAQAAGDDSGQAIADNLVAVSKDGTDCTGWQECFDMLEAGEDINYEGASGPTDLNDTGSPDFATIGIQLYDGKNQYKQIDTISGVIE